MRQFKIKFLQIEYIGESVGEDIHVVLELLGKNFEFDLRIQHGSVFEINKELCGFESDQDELNVKVKIKVVEKDKKYSDIGTAIGVLTLKDDVSTIEISVREKRKKLLAKTGILKASFQVEIGKTQTALKLKQYKKRGNEDYNRYDQKIADAVDYGNLVFSLQTDPPPKLLDVNLVKAMLYVEGRIGYDKHIKERDVMQVADERNPAIHAFQAVSKKQKDKIEYEILNGEEVPLDYPQANGKTEYESIKWGVRWLYKKAQKNVKGKVWKRKWLDWKEAVFEYNDEGDKNYVEKVYSVYGKRYDVRDQIKLWSIVFFLIANVAVSSLVLSSKVTARSQQYSNLWDALGLSEDDARLNRVHAQALEDAWHAQNAEDKAKLEAEMKQAEDQYAKERAAISEQDKALVDCLLVQGDLAEARLLQNSTYKITNPRQPIFSEGSTTIKLTDGAYSYDRSGIKKYIDHEPEKDGPKHVSCERIIRADLNMDGLLDALVLLTISGGDRWYWPELFAMLKVKDGTFRQVSSLSLGDDEEFIGVTVENGIICAGMRLNRAQDLHYYPTLEVVKKYKLLKNKLVETND